MRRYFRTGAAFAKPDIYEYLEELGFLYAIRLNSRSSLAWIARDIACSDLRGH